VWPGELRELDMRIADAIVVATLRTGRSWAELRERHRTVFQNRLVVPPELQRAADELVEREGIDAALEQAAALWLTTTMDLAEFNRGVLGVIESPPDADGPSATP
jgi:hypothetical protein